jgi:hypothetical protein
MRKRRTPVFSTTRVDVEDPKRVILVFPCKQPSQERSDNTRGALLISSSNEKTGEELEAPYSRAGSTSSCIGSIGSRSPAPDRPFD